MGQVNVSLLLRNGTSEEWKEVNPVLKDAELGLEKDTNLMKVGDGVTPWLDLPYINGYEAAIQQELAQKLDKTGGAMTGELILNYVPINSNEAVNKRYVDEQIATYGSLKREIVTELPSENVDPNVIYMMKDEEAIGPDYYNEYMLIDGELVQIGTTSVDLTNYLQLPSSYNNNSFIFLNNEGQVVSSDVSAETVAEKANDADLANIAKSGDVADLTQTDTVLVFDCGTSLLNI